MNTDDREWAQTTIEDAIAAKHEAVDRVEAGREQYVERAVAELDRMLRVEGRAFVTSEAVRARCPIPEGVEPRVLGAVIREAQRRLGLVRVGWETGRAHARPIARWALIGADDNKGKGHA
ncbi:MAG: hypothetical protein ACU85V_00230 [Gammaproteobacteria bacterium]